MTAAAAPSSPNPTQQRGFLPPRLSPTGHGSEPTIAPCRGPPIPMARSSCVAPQSSPLPWKPSRRWDPSCSVGSASAGGHHGVGRSYPLTLHIYWTRATLSFLFGPAGCNEKDLNYGIHKMLRKKSAGGL
ncbi:hypothetical protein ZWY2020_044207 [Hordeum vulgare]|nr:hypothetical protein ZWY2020_044207 [Hordeum vulgare]